jgi:outer membrane receptor protein involved in Fe transport
MTFSGLLKCGAGRFAIATGMLMLAAPQVALAQEARSEPEATQIDDIIVTARKREERSIDVPIAITAVSGETLEQRGVRNIAEFLQEAPGVGIYDTGGGYSKVTIRGVSTSLGANENGYYLDDLPFTGVTVPIAPVT